METCGEFVGELFKARDLVHLAHLESNKWGTHIILNDLYDDLLEHADQVAELLLARKSIKITIPASSSGGEITNYLDRLVTKVDSAKTMADDKGYNDISAEIDGIKITLIKALYKLKKLVQENGEEEGSEGGHSEYMRRGGKITHIKKKPLLKR